MSSIDNRIVEMKFENKDFMAGVKTTLDYIEKLKTGLKFDKAKDSIKDLSDETKKFSLDNIGNALDNISSKFNAFGAIGFAALQRVTNFAIDAGKKMASALIDPIVQGGQRRAKNIEQARFQFQGLGMDVNATMASASAAVDGTAFALDEAAVVAAQFGATGLRAGDEMTNALKGIAGVAAMSGAGFAEIGDVFGKIAGQGRAMGDDMNRLATRGVNAYATLAKYLNKTETEVRDMTTKGQISFELFATAMNDAFGEHATKANETYTGALSNMRSALARIGQLWFYGVDINEKGNGVFERQRILFLALTKVINQVKDALVPLFAVLNDIYNMGNKKKAKLLESLDLHQFARFMWIIAGAVKAFHEAVQSYLKPIGQAFRTVFKQIKPPDGAEPWFLHLAWAIRDFAESLVLSAEGAQKVYLKAKNFFTAMKNGGAIIKGVVRYFVDTVKIIWDLAMAFGRLLVPVVKFAQGFMGAKKPVKDFSDVITTFFDTVISVRRAGVDILIGAMDRLAGALDRILNGDRDPMDWGKKWANAMGSIKGFLTRVVDGFRAFGQAVGSIFGPAVDQLKKQLQDVRDTFSGTADFAKGVWGAVKGFFSAIGSGIDEYFGGISSEEFLAGLNATAIVGVVAALVKTLKDTKETLGLAKVFEEGFSETFEELTNVLKMAQNDLKANILLKIAAAIGILAGALMLMTMVDLGKLGGATAAMGALFGMLVGSLYGLSKIVTPKDLAQIPVLAFSIGLLAGAMLIMAVAFKLIGSMEWDKVAQGVGAFSVALAGLVGATKILSTAGKDVMAGAGAMIVMAIAVTVLAGAVALFGLMPREMLEQGMASVGILLAGLVAAAVILGQLAPNMLKSALGIGAMAVALNLLLVPIFALAKMPREILEKGIGVLVILLGILVGASVILGQFAPKMAVTAGVLMAMAAAINLLVPPLVILGLMPWEVLGKGLIGLAGAMAVMVVAALAMSRATTGAAGIVAMSFALSIFAGTLIMMAAIDPDRMAATIVNLSKALMVLAVASMVFSMIGKHLIVAAVALAIMSLAFIGFGIGLAILTPAVALFITTIAALAPTIKEAGKSAGWMALLGVGLLVFGLGAVVAGIGLITLGAGLVLLGAGLALIATFGPIGALALTAVVKALMKMVQYIPDIVDLGAAFIVLGAGLILVGAGLVIVGLGLILLATGVLIAATALQLLIDMFSKSEEEAQQFTSNIAMMAPAIGDSLASGVESFTTKIEGMIPLFKEVVGKMLDAFFELVNEKIPVWGETVTNFLLEINRVIETVGPDSIRVLGLLIDQFVESIVEKTPDFVLAGIKILNGLIDGLGEEIPKLVAKGGQMIVDFLAEVRKQDRAIRDEAVETIVQFIEGIGEANDKILTAGKDVIIDWIEGMGDAAGDIVQAATDTIEKFLDEVDAAAVRLSERFQQSGKTIGLAIADGMTMGLASKTEEVLGKARSIASQVIKIIATASEVKSPSRATYRIGGFIGQGLANGIADSGGIVEKSASRVAGGVMDTMQSILTAAFDILEDDQYQPVIRPVVDLDNVSRQAAELDRILSTDHLQDLSLAVNSGLTRAGGPIFVETKREPSVTHVEYSQTNISPKPLSSVDIYRQTRNQLGSLKGVVVDKVT